MCEVAAHLDPCPLWPGLGSVGFVCVLQILIGGEYFGAGEKGTDEIVQCVSHNNVMHNPYYPIQVSFGHLNDAGLPFRREFRAVNCTIETPDVLMSCLMGSGTGRDHFWRLSVDGQTTNLLNTSTFFAPPFVTQLDGPSASAARTQGGEVRAVVCAFLCVRLRVSGLPLCTSRVL